jgi:hypothetical protein
VTEATKGIALCFQKGTNMSPERAEALGLEFESRNRIITGSAAALSGL